MPSTTGKCRRLGRRQPVLAEPPPSPWIKAKPSPRVRDGGSATHRSSAASGPMRLRSGFKSTAQIDTMIDLALTGNYNAIVPEILAFQDTAAVDTAAYWDSDIVPMPATSSARIDPLAYLVQQAHANGLEVHPWLVAFRVLTWPPSGNARSPPIRMADDAAPGMNTDRESRQLLYLRRRSPARSLPDEHRPRAVRQLRDRCIHWDYIRYTQH